MDYDPNHPNYMSFGLKLFTVVGTILLVILAAIGLIGGFFFIVRITNE